MSTHGQSASHPGYPFSNSPSQGGARPGQELLNQRGSDFGPGLVHRPLLRGVPGNLPGDSETFPGSAALARPRTGSLKWPREPDLFLSLSFTCHPPMARSHALTPAS